MRLFCLVYSFPITQPFAVTIDDDQTVSDLKKLIKEERRPEFDAYAADRLTLWKWNKPTDKIEGLTHSNVLDARDTIGDVFLDEPPYKKRTHIIINALGN